MANGINVTQREREAVKSLAKEALSGSPDSEILRKLLLSWDDASRWGGIDPASLRRVSVDRKRDVAILLRNVLFKGLSPRSFDVETHIRRIIVEDHRKKLQSYERHDPAFIEIIENLRKDKFLKRMVLRRSSSRVKRKKRR